MSEAVKELIDIVIKLRSENGCDWDRKQTSESLTPHSVSYTHLTLPTTPYV